MKIEYERDFDRCGIKFRLPEERKHICIIAEEALLSDPPEGMGGRTRFHGDLEQTFEAEYELIFEIARQMMADGLKPEITSLDSPYFRRSKAAMDSRRQSR